MSDDAELLRRYVDERSETAFGELVQRHLRLVYFAALRQVGGDAHRAQDVAQTVFTDLARKARPLSRHASLTGWLYTSTHFAAAKAVRTEQRRQAREQQAHRMQENSDSSGAVADWDRLRPVLDDVMLELNDRDREAVLLRFFQGCAFAEIGARLRLTEDAARMRVDRALEKLRERLTQRGVASSAAALGLALVQQASAAAPTGLAVTLTSAVVSGVAATAGASTSSIGFFLMNKTYLGGVGVLAVLSVGGLVWQQRTNAQVRGELRSLQDQAVSLTRLRSENARLVRNAAEAATLHREDVDLDRLRSEIAALKTKLAPTNAKTTAKAVAWPGLDQAPRVKFQPKPIYPPELQRQRAYADVLLSFEVGELGQVQRIIVLRANVVPNLDGKRPPMMAQAFRDFSRAATMAAASWSFDPASAHGQVVGTKVQVAVKFRAGEAQEIVLEEPAPWEPSDNWF